MEDVPCSRLLRQVQAYIIKQETELDVLRAQLDARGGGITEADLPEHLRRRLMPAGHEWPRFEDEEPLREGDRYVDADGAVRKVGSVQTYGNGGFDVTDSAGGVGFYDPGERMRRPSAPDPGRREAEPDSWDRLARDVELFGCHYAGTRPDENDRERDGLVRRAKALCAGPDVVRPGEVV